MVGNITSSQLDHLIYLPNSSCSTGSHGKIQYRKGTNTPDAYQRYDRAAKFETGYCTVHQATGQRLTSPARLTDSHLDQFDDRKGATWHCIVGRNFGSYVTHGMLNFSIQLAAVAHFTFQKRSISSTSTSATAPSCSSRLSSAALRVDDLLATSFGAWRKDHVVLHHSHVFSYGD